MDKMKNLSYLFLLMALMVSCSESYVIQGTSSVSRLDGSKLYLKVVKDKKLSNLDSCEVVHGKFHFSEVGIKPGEEVVFIEDESIRPVVVDDRHIEYNGQVVSLSALAQQLKQTPYPQQGTVWFTYKGEKLATLRDKMEKKR